MWNPIKESNCKLHGSLMILPHSCLFIILACKKNYYICLFIWISVQHDLKFGGQFMLHTHKNINLLCQNLQPNTILIPQCSILSLDGEKMESIDTLYTWIILPNKTFITIFIFCSKEGYTMRQYSLKHYILYYKVGKCTLCYKICSIVHCQNL